MKDTQLYSELLNLPEPWEVDEVELDPHIEEIVVKVIYKGKDAPCPKCGKRCKIYDHRKVRRWRHLDTCQMKTYIEATPPRISCREHGYVTVKVPWAENNSRFTMAFEILALTILQTFRKQTKTAKILRISFDQINYLMKRSVTRGLSRRESKQNIEYIGIDEKSIKKHHNYASILIDHSNGAVIELTEGRSEESAKSLIENNLTEEQRKGVKAITMDFWDAYINAAKSKLPGADIVHDRFHISKYLNKAVDEVRRKEIKALEKDKRKILKNTRYIFLQNPANWTDAYKVRFQEIQTINLRTSKAWIIKENFREFFNSRNIAQATFYFNSWQLEAAKQNLEPVNKVIKTFLSYLEGILNYVKYKITNAIAESINSLIQEIKYMARGFRNFKNFRVSVLFYLGKLDLYP